MEDRNKPKPGFTGFWAELAFLKMDYINLAHCTVPTVQGRLRTFKITNLWVLNNDVVRYYYGLQIGKMTSKAMLYNPVLLIDQFDMLQA